MKKLLALLFALCLTLSAAAPASALEVQASGYMAFVFGVNKNTNFTDTESEKTILAAQRSRITFELIADENLRGVLQFQLGTSNWGDASEGAGLDTTSSSPLTRRAYIDWSLESTPLNFKFGLQEIALPSAVAGNPVLASNVAGIVASFDATDDIALSAFWARPFVNREDINGNTVNHKNTTDYFGLIADFNLEPVRIQPWITYALIGFNSFPSEESGGGWDYSWLQAADEGKMINLGVAVSAQVTPEFSLNLDAMWGKLSAEHANTSGATEADGWFAALSADYKLDWGTPGIVLWYASGNEDKKARYSNQMPLIGVDGGFNPLRLAFMGTYDCGTDTLIGANGAGTAGVVLQIQDMSFIENLSHTFRVGYIIGTNEKRSDHLANFNWGIALSEKDYAIEVDFDSTYEVRKNLNIILELGYIYLDADKNYYNRTYNEENALNAQVTLSYEF